MVDTELAWDLAATAQAHLDANQRNAVYVAIAVGDGFWAARFLLQTIVRSGLAVPADLMLKVNRWVASYRDHPEQVRLRELIGRVRIEPFDVIRDAPRRLAAELRPDRRGDPSQLANDINKRSPAHQRLARETTSERNYQ